MSWKRVLRWAALALVGGLTAGLITGVLTARAEAPDCCAATTIVP